MLETPYVYGSSGWIVIVKIVLYCTQFAPQVAKLASYKYLFQAGQAEYCSNVHVSTGKKVGQPGLENLEDQRVMRAVVYPKTQYHPTAMSMMVKD